MYVTDYGNGTVYSDHAGFADRVKAVAKRRPGRSSRASGVCRYGDDKLRAAGGRPRRRAGPGADALTASERRVAELAAGGVSNKEIAQSLFVTLRTVELHLSNTDSKLGIRSRHELGAAPKDPRNTTSRPPRPEPTR